MCGWRGVAVEPVSYVSRKLCNNYQPFPRVRPLRAAISSHASAPGGAYVSLGRGETNKCAGGGGRARVCHSAGGAHVFSLAMNCSATLARRRPRARLYITRSRVRLALRAACATIASVLNLCGAAVHTQADRGGQRDQVQRAGPSARRADHDPHPLAALGDGGAAPRRRTPRGATDGRRRGQQARVAPF
eukprot:5733753-Prymnesium_polylepis.2